MSLHDVAVAVASGAIGAGAGYGWYRLVGCRNGACLITSNPWISAAYGAVLGLLLSGTI